MLQENITKTFQGASKKKTRCPSKKVFISKKSKVRTKDYNENSNFEAEYMIRKAYYFSNNKGDFYINYICLFFI